MEEALAQLAARIRDAAARGQPLRLRGAGTKDFYGEALRGDVLDTTPYRGIVDYDPTELVLTARCGTPLDEIENLMRSEGQMLGFEPPHFGSGATFGGCIAAGLSGPRRPFAGSVRDFVLGVRLLDGTAKDLRFGGRVMKNVAGYDVARLSVGALGTLGVVLEASIKAIPLPRADITICLEMEQADAIRTMNTWAGRPLPISATCHVEDRVFVRLSGAVPAVEVARSKLGGEIVPDAARFWSDLREHRLEHFTAARPLWRVSLRPTAPPLELAGAQLVEWNGALRWIATHADPVEVRAAAAGVGGHATLFRATEKPSGAFHPQTLAMHGIHKRLKAVFDPHGILNPGRLYPDL